MRALFDRREVRAIRREIVTLSAAELIAELEPRKANVAGTIPVLRDQLIRAVNREDAALVMKTPWYEMDRAAREVEEEMQRERERVAF